MEILYPDTVEGVMDALAAARLSRTPIHPVSTDRNWGYRSEHTTQGLVLNLSRLNRIRNAQEISARQPVAVIEPGVTQGQLADFLAQHHPGLTFNITGSARETSILGNALDRGVGYRGPKREDLFGLEVITGSGERIFTGFRRLGSESPIAHAHRYGLGPELDGLFFQGNFGIVVSACLRLLPRPPCERAVSLSLRRPQDLGDLLDALIAVRRDGLVSSVTHVGNRARTHSSLARGLHQALMKEGLESHEAQKDAASILQTRFRSSWSALLSISGHERDTRARIKEIRARTAPWADVQVVSPGLLDAADRMLALWPGRAPRKLMQLRALLAAIKPLNGLALGKPTDEPVRNLLWMAGQHGYPVEEFGQSDVGILYISPALPLEGRLVQDFVTRWSGIVQAHGLEFYVTLNIESENSMVAIMNLLFKKSQIKDAIRARRCAEELYADIRRLGLEVYRARDDMMNLVTDPDDPYWKTVEQLKQVFDPDKIISPGRYNLA